MPEAKKRSTFIAMIALIALAATAVPSEAHGEQRYTAQRRPRVTITQFKDTNTMATDQRFGQSVSAMLVTFLKQKSQFVVVERQDIQSVLAEWQRNQEGQTKSNLSGADMELLERIDVIIQGSVTVLGNRIEVDGKILSREDGRIIVAAQRSGPVNCLRQVVDRLGIALENGFLTPYYGRVQLTLYEPENVHFLLTPVLTPTALDEEKPPGELEATIFPGEDQDKIKKWTANPATRTIENILAGWYTLRLTREGYEDVKIPNDFLRAVETSRGFEIMYHKDREMIPLAQAPDGKRIKELLVRVDSLATNEIDLSQRDVEMRKKQGALNFIVLDEDKKPISDARIMMRSVALSINPEYRKALQKQLEDIQRTESETKEAAEPSSRSGEDMEVPTDESESDRQLERALYMTLGIVGKSLEREQGQEQEQVEKPSDQEEVACNFFKEEFAHVFDHGKTIVYSGDSFHLDDFKGGNLYFQEYHGEIVPVGLYEITAWAPRLQTRKMTVMISEDKTEAKIRRVELKRQRRDVLMVGKSNSKIQFRGVETLFTGEYGLDTTTGLHTISLPVDLYEMESTIEGFGIWKRQLDLRPSSEDPPPFEEILAAESLSSETSPDTPSPLTEMPPVEVRVKSTVWVGGRFQGFRPYPHTFYNPRVGELLDQILEGTPVYDWSSPEAEDDKLATLTDQLRDIDLLILNEDDMSRIRVFPELAMVIRNYVEEGRSLMAFVAREGDYQNVLGEPLTLKRRFSNSDRVRLNLEAREPKFDYDIDLGWGRRLPRMKKKHIESTGWRIVSYTKKMKKPRIIESGNLDGGGYVMVWLETSRAWAQWQTFTGQSSGLGRIFRPFHRLFGGAHESLPPNNGGNPPPDDSNSKDPKDSKRKIDIEEEIRIAEAIWKARQANDQIALARAEMEGQALLWAQYLMYRRLGSEDKKIQELRQRITIAP